MWADSFIITLRLYNKHYFFPHARAFQTQGSFQMSQTPLLGDNSPVDIVASLKRRIDVLQAQNEELCKEPRKEKRCV